MPNPTEPPPRFEFGWVSAGTLEQDEALVTLLETFIMTLLADHDPWMHGQLRGWPPLKPKEDQP
jgi:hypothetical protein